MSTLSVCALGLELLPDLQLRCSFLSHSLAFGPFYEVLINTNLPSSTLYKLLNIRTQRDAQPFAALVEDPGKVSSIHTAAQKHLCCLVPGDCPLFWPFWVLQTCGTQTYRQTLKINNNSCNCCKNGIYRRNGSLFCGQHFSWSILEILIYGQRREKRKW